MFSFNNIRVNTTITPIDDLNDTHVISTPAGVVGIREGEDRCWINNPLVTIDSLIFPTLQTLDDNAKSAQVTEQTEGSFVLRLNTNAATDVRIGFLIVNP